MPLLFKGDDARQTFAAFAHADLREEMERFLKFSEVHGLPWPMVTCAGRTPEENKATPGSVENSGHIFDLDHGDDSIEAVDLRIRHYSPEELKAAIVYWRERQDVTKGHVYFVSNLNHGTAPHLHVGVRIAKEPAHV